eukprot:3099372-Pleurochrysis_carterae.AAC.1
MRRTVSEPTPEELANPDYDPEKDLAKRKEELAFSNSINAVKIYQALSSTENPVKEHNYIVTQFQPHTCTRPEERRRIREELKRQQ